MHRRPIVFEASLPPAARLGFGLTAALALVAFWNLLLRLPLPFLVIAGLASAAVATWMLLIALFGINRRVELDSVTRTVLVTESHLMSRTRTYRYAFTEVAHLEVCYHDWADGPSTYSIQLTPCSTLGKPVKFGFFSTRPNAEDALVHLREMIRRSM